MTIQYFRFEVEPTVFDRRETQLRITIDLSNGQRIEWRQLWFEDHIETLLKFLVEAGARSLAAEIERVKNDEPMTAFAKHLAEALADAEKRRGGL